MDNLSHNYPCYPFLSGALSHKLLPSFLSLFSNSHNNCHQDEQPKESITAPPGIEFLHHKLLMKMNIWFKHIYFAFTIIQAYTHIY